MANKIDSIAFICEGLSYEYGGQAVSIPSLGNALAKRSILVNYFIAEDKTPRIIQLNNKSKTFFCKTYGKKAKFSIDLFFKLRRYRHTFDLVHINNLWNFVPIIAYIFCRLYDKPYVISTRGMAMHEIIQNNFIKYIFFRIVLYKILIKAKFIHTTSLNEENSLIKLRISTKIVIAPNGINNIVENANFKTLEQLRQKSKTVLFVGKLCEHKNIDILVRAFALFSKEKDDWKLSIVGNDEDSIYVKSINSIIKAEGLHNKINILGFKAGNDLAKEYERASFFVSTSKSENFGLSIAEALRAGLPSIVPFNSPWRMISEHNCGFAIKPNISKIAKSMIYISENLINREDIFYNAINFTRDFSWDSQAITLNKEYIKE